MYAIRLQPVFQNDLYFWIEGGLFNTKQSAEFQAKQIRKMKEFYSKVEVIKI